MSCAPSIGTLGNDLKAKAQAFPSYHHDTLDSVEGETARAAGLIAASKGAEDHVAAPQHQTPIMDS